ncbi:MAG: FtsX-like permease family protein [Candidatus Omnitrophota bacterium]
MWFYIKLAWRNILRNKRRTIIAAIAIGVGLAALLLDASIMKGMMKGMMRSSTSSFLGEAEIHRENFRESQEVERTIHHKDKLANDLAHDPLVDRFTFRTLSMGMITSPANVDAILLVGVNPQTESPLSKYDEAVGKGKGTFFAGKPNIRDIVIGSKMAEILEVELGDRVVVTTAKAYTGELSQEMFRISGIYHFGIKSMDTGMAFIHIEQAQQMLGIPGQVHEAAIKFKDIRTSLEKNNPFWKRYSRNGNEAVSWITLLPQMDMVFRMSKFGLIIIIFILAALVTFGIINVLFMSLYERMFEFGVLRAVGTRPGGIRKLILFEAGALAVISIIIGLALSALVLSILSYTGLDYRGIEMAGAVIQENIYPEPVWWYFLAFPVGVFFFTVGIGLYPAWVGGRMRIADAIRKSL